MASLIFNCETTARTDFQSTEIRPVVKTKYVDNKRSCVRMRPPPLKHLATMSDWRVSNVPFNVFGRAKDIIQTDPNHLQEPFSKPVNEEERKKVQMSRPRLVMTPAGSLDDTDDGKRQTLLDDVYKTSSQLALQQAIERANQTVLDVKSPLPKKPAPTIPIGLTPLCPPFVSPEWRMDSASWDNRQLRSYANSTRRFWLNKTPQIQEAKEADKNETRMKYN